MDQHTDPQYKTDDGNALRMWRDVAPNNFLSEREGRPIFDEVIYAEIIAPGSGNSTPVFEVVRYMAKESDRKEPKAGAKYEELKKFIKDFNESEGDNTSLSGTPLTQWPEMNRTLVATLKAQKVFTVEGLAALPDGKLSVVGPDGRTWRDKAVAYLAAAKDGAYATKIAAELVNVKTDNANLREQMAALSEQMTAMQASAAPTRPTTASKPPKVETLAAANPGEILVAAADPLAKDTIAAPASII